MNINQLVTTEKDFNKLVKFKIPLNLIQLKQVVHVIEGLDKLDESIGKI